ncbi:MAG TPA: ornithine cyclodeaminase family protein [Micropepsaceae bacterium]|jgi:ornithine cyclodeaminase/alanine dehydrogenase-like protein (mu-crystallin family)
MTLILSNTDIDSVLTMRECIDVLEDAYWELAHGRGVSRTRSDSFSETKRPDALYSLKSMDGIVPKLGVGAVRINSDIITWPKQGENERRVKVPSAPDARYVGLVLLFSTETGEPLAIFPDGVMQRMRVGAANALGVKYLARPKARQVAILGSGWQAGAQLMGVCAVRDVEIIRCYSPNAQHCDAFAQEWSARLGVRVMPVPRAEDAIAEADIVMCATNTIDNVFFARWIKPGLHISSIKRPEVETDAIKHADLVVLHSNDASPAHLFTRGVTIPETAENKGWMLASEIAFDKLSTLPQLIAGLAPGRTREDQVTCFLNNIGLGYQFAACGALVYRKAREQGLGRDLPTDWFTEDVHP